MNEEAPKVIETKEGLKLKILAADDEEFKLEFVQRALEPLGHRVEIVPNGELLISKLLEEGANFDLVISDNNMGSGKKGIEVLEEIRSIDQFKKLPFIIATTDTGDVINRIQKEGAFFLPKPFGMAELRNAVKEATIDK